MDRRVFAASLIILLVAAPAVSFPGTGYPGYQVEDLGTTSDGLVPTVTGINASGQVSGYVNHLGGLSARCGTRTAPGGSTCPDFNLSTVSRPRSTPAATSPVITVTPGLGMRAFRYVDGIGVATIPALPGGTFASGFAIADNGEVVGYGNSGRQATRAWRTGPGYWNPADSSRRPLSASVSRPAESTPPDRWSGAFTTGGFSTRVPARNQRDADGHRHASGATTSSACGLDADGRVGGQSKVGAGIPTRSCSSGGAPYRRAHLRLDVQHGRGDGQRRRRGHVHGFVRTGQNHAFVHTDAGGTTDLNTPYRPDRDGSCTDARAVSSNGQIVGQGLLAGSPRAFRLTPGASRPTRRRR